MCDLAEAVVHVGGRHGVRFPYVLLKTAFRSAMMLWELINLSRGWTMCAVSTLADLQTGMTAPRNSQSWTKRHEGLE